MHHGEHHVVWLRVMIITHHNEAHPVATGAFDVVWTVTQRDEKG